MKWQDEQKMLLDKYDVEDIPELTAFIKSLLKKQREICAETLKQDEINISTTSEALRFELLKVGIANAPEPVK